MTLRSAGLLALVAACAPSDRSGGVGVPDPFVDLDPDPAVFEAELIARPANVQVGDEVARLLTYGGRFPGPQIRVRQGDRVVVHVQNELPDDFPTTVHWHGIEGTNGSDGTHTTQAPILPGERFSYDFRVPRAGIYWFHPHVRGAQGIHSGLYGTLIVDDPDEAQLEQLGVLPSLRHTMVLSDLGLYDGEPIRTESDDDLVLMNGTEGAMLLVNGQVRPRFQVPAGQGVRLQVVNTSIARYWRLAAPDHTLFRVGGQAGLLEYVRVEGGTQPAIAIDGGTDSEVSLGYPRGQILLAPGERADLVLVPVGEPGDSVVLRWEDFARGRHGMSMEGGQMVMGDADDDGSRPGVEVALFELTERQGPDYQIAEGDPVLAAVGRTVTPVDPGPSPLRFVGQQATVLGERMQMLQDPNGAWRHEAAFLIDGQSWTHPPEHGGADLPLAPTARQARLGDRIVWEVRNDTEMAHPFHLHGFAYQPIAFEGPTGPHGEGERVRWELDHVEYADTTHIPPHTSLFLHVGLDDPNGDGGGLGRWMVHCHLVQHAEAGMMSELVVTGP